MFFIGVLWLCTALYQMLSVSNVILFINWKILLIEISFRWQFDIHFTQSSVSALSVTSFMFIYCFCGNLLTVRCEKVNEAIIQSFWYKYPIKFQMFIKMILIRNQKSFYITGFKVTQCSFETFKKVSSCSHHHKSKFIQFHISFSFSFKFK